MHDVGTSGHHVARGNAGAFDTICPFREPRTGPAVPEEAHMTWLLITALVWVVLVLPAALLIGRSIRRAEARRAADAEARLRVEAAAQSETMEGNVATEPPATELPWTGPETVPFPPPPSVPRRRPYVVRNPLSRAERSPSQRDSGVL